MTKRVAVSTLGCKINLYESELILQKYANNDYIRVPDTEQADIYIINSCTVTAEADRQTRQLARKLKRNAPNSKVVVTGCYAETQPDAVADIEGVDFVVGNAAKMQIPVLVNPAAGQMPKANKSLVRDMASSAIHSTDQTPASGTLAEAAPKPNPAVIIRPDLDAALALPQDLLKGYDQHSRAFIQVQQGCNQGCTFCIIHTARGKSASFPVDTVVAQYKMMVGEGYQEVVLCGVDLGDYGSDQITTPSLADLIRALVDCQLDCRIRISSIDPFHITDDLITTFALPDVCDHLHLSMQSADTLILKRMKRRASRELIFDRVERLKAVRPSLVVSADVLVGFPTETDEHFAVTLEAIDALGIAYPHVFPYSPRIGTPAAKIPKQVPKPIIKARAKAAREKGDEVLQTLLKNSVGLLLDCVVEQRDENNNCFLRSSNYLPVKVSSSYCKPGDRVTVKINAAEKGGLVGSLLH